MSSQNLPKELAQAALKMAATLRAERQATGASLTEASRLWPTVNNGEQYTAQCIGNLERGDVILTEKRVAEYRKVIEYLAENYEKPKRQAPTHKRVSNEEILKEISELRTEISMLRAVVAQSLARRTETVG